VSSDDIEKICRILERERLTTGQRVALHEQLRRLKRKMIDEEIEKEAWKQCPHEDGDGATERCGFRLGAKWMREKMWREELKPVEITLEEFMKPEPAPDWVKEWCRLAFLQGFSLFDNDDPYQAFERFWESKTNDVLPGR
jgi:hypothetical protein